MKTLFLSYLSLQICHSEALEKFFVFRFFAPLKMTTLILFLLPLFACAQTTNWSITNTSPSIYNAFHYIDKNLFETSGLVKIIADTPVAITISIQATTTQHGKTTISTKQIIIDTCTSCFTFNGLSYCGVWYNGVCWLDRNLGANSLGSIGSNYANSGWSINYPNSNCPTGYRMPTKTESKKVFDAGVRWPTDGNWMYYYNTSACNLCGGDTSNDSTGNAVILYEDNAWYFGACSVSCVNWCGSNGGCGSRRVYIRCIKS